MTDTQETFLDFSVGDLLIEDLKAVLRQHHSSHPRHQQVTLGPSQIGHPCPRHLISALLDLEPVNPQFDPLPSYIGVASHRALEDALALDNSRRVEAGEPERWISEHRVEIAIGLAGTCDLFDTQTNTVIDFKFPGTTAMTKYRKNGPSGTYRTQAHLYGKGYANEGKQVDHVGIWFLPRAGTLAGSHLWIEDYSETIAAQAISRFDSMILLADELQIEHNIANLNLIPRVNTDCAFCPWYAKDAEGHSNPAACNGEGFDPAHRDRKKKK
jgi:hypothetical protein